MYLTQVISNLWSLIWVQHWSDRDYCWSHHTLVETRHSEGHLLTWYLSNWWSHKLLLWLLLLYSLISLLSLFIFSLILILLNLCSLLLGLCLLCKGWHSHHLLILLCHLLLIWRWGPLIILLLIGSSPHLVHKWLHLLLQCHGIIIHLLYELWPTHLH